MLLAEVLGNATATVKHRSLDRCRLLVVQPYLVDGQTPDGEPVLAIDVQGARRGDWVILTSDGKAARELVGDSNTPIRWTVLGIRD